MRLILLINAVYNVNEGNLVESFMGLILKFPIEQIGIRFISKGPLG